MPRTGLDASQVLDIAATLADCEGLPTLTFARLAAELQVKPPSLYNHFAGLDALRDALAKRALEELLHHSRDAVAGLSGPEALTALAQAQRSYAQQHPGLYESAHLAVKKQSEATRSVGEAYVKLTMAVLRGYGLSGEVALHAVLAIRSAVRGFLEIELGGGFGLPLDLDVSFQVLLHMLDSGLRAGKRSGL